MEFNVFGLWPNDEAKTTSTIILFGARYIQVGYTVNMLLRYFLAWSLKQINSSSQKRGEVFSLCKLLKQQSTNEMKKKMKTILTEKKIFTFNAELKFVCLRFIL